MTSPAPRALANRAAFLSMLSFSEGTSKHGLEDSYKVIVGGTLFHSFKDHPRKLVRINDKLSSTAAGRYQILARIYDHYKEQLGLLDFSPASQDAIAFQLIRECQALGDIDAGRFEVAVKKCKSRWASLPGANYPGQRMNRISELRRAYVQAGGTLA